METRVFVDDFTVHAVQKSIRTTATNHEKYVKTCDAKNMKNHEKWLQKGNQNQAKID